VNLSNAIPLNRHVLSSDPNDFAIAASDVTVQQGSSGASTISTTLTSGSPESISLSHSGLPAGATASFDPNPVTTGSSSTLTINTGAAATGQYTVTVTGAGSVNAHSTTFRLTVTAPPPPPANVVQNPGFETGDFSFWARSGSVRPTIRSEGHTGRYSARAGAPSAFHGNSVFQQAVRVPSGSPTLSFWYRPSCPDSIARDQIQMQIRNVQGAQLATVLNLCSNTSTWTFTSYNISGFAGRTIVLWFNVHDDGRPTNPTYALFDDIFVG
jgi:hypothetical protein